MNAQCNNCKGAHRATSNKCPIRQRYLIIPRTNNDVKTQNSFRSNSESSYFLEAPPPHPLILGLTTIILLLIAIIKFLFSPLQNFPPAHNYQPSNYNTNNPPASYPHPLLPNNVPLAINDSNVPSSSFNNAPLATNNISNAPLEANYAPLTTTNPPFIFNINYDQILATATKFDVWPLAFNELQKAFQVSPIIEIPTILHNQLKPNYYKVNQSDQSTLPIIPPSSPSLPDLTRQPSPHLNITPTTSTPLHIPQTKNSFKNNNKPSNSTNKKLSPTNSIISNQSYPLHQFLK